MVWKNDLDRLLWSPEGLPMLPMDELIFFGTTAAESPIAAQLYNVEHDKNMISANI